MKYAIILILSMAFACTLASAQESEIATEQELQPWIEAEKESVRGKTGDMISFVLLTVKDEHKQEFETWIDDVLYGALYKSKNPIKKAQLNAVRYFEPVRQNEDGTWHYCWIMDPIIPKTSYDIPLFLEQEYGKEKGQEHWDKYRSMVEDRAILFRQTGK